ncbi:MAG: copper chaperone PCu(A)C [Ilumatobacteraceae bacterium]
MTRRSILTLACTASLLFAACGSDEETAADTAAPADTIAPAEATTTAVGVAAVTITGAWARTSPASAANGAAYMVITSAADDRLLGASLDASIAETVEIHETVMSSETGMTDPTAMTPTTGAMSGNTMAPAMEMREVEAIELPAGEAVELQPGGYHVMIVGLVSPLVVGQELELTLTFDNAGEVVVTVPVRDDAP